MATIRLLTVNKRFDITIAPGETILEALRRSDVPLSAVLLLDRAGAFVSVTQIPAPGDEIRAYSLRNTDFHSLLPEYDVVRTFRPAAELVEEAPDGKRALIQLSRDDVLDYIYACVEQVLTQYLAAFSGDTQVLQFALSPGGDGRILAECIRRFWDNHPQARFHCVICAVGFEDEEEHISNAIRLANTYALPFTALGVREGAALLGYSCDLQSLSDLYRSEFPCDEPEVLLTYWVQEINQRIAQQAGRRGIIMGYNFEDALAEQLYAALTRRQLEPLPVRQLDGFDLIAPLVFVPKRLLDALDIENSLRNYSQRLHPVGHTRSAMYFLAYFLVDRFPALARGFVTGARPPVGARDPAEWLHSYRLTNGGTADVRDSSSRRT